LKEKERERERERVPEESSHSFATIRNLSPMVTTLTWPTGCYFVLLLIATATSATHSFKIEKCYKNSFINLFESYLLEMGRRINTKILRVLMNKFHIILIKHTP
jgi:hypothetical protein